MLLQFCDKCGRPLSEGAIARGEAVERDGETICSNCVAKQPVRTPEAAEPGPLGEYHSAVWHCEGCGIPVTALDLIEGRASRLGGVLSCSRCTAARKDPTAETERRVLPKPPAMPARPAESLPRVMPAATRPQPTRAAEEFVAGARQDQRRPILPIVLIIIVLPMFAVSLWFAVTSQQRLNEMAAERGNQSPDRGQPTQRSNRVRDAGPPADTPTGENPGGEKPPDNRPTGPTPAPAQPDAPIPLAADVADDLVAIENELAAPVIAKLQSTDLGQVWDGLIEAGSRRLIATRPYVRALLGVQDDETRVIACRVCAMLDDKLALPELTRLADSDPSEAVATEARKARDRLTGQSTREVRDMTDAELEKLVKELQEELKRRKGRSD
ncbi:MAG: hypothetical protein IT464_07065 [Planctomycetes bacterium]|nr:hypothetical protein [Planctomycetota bacterium]